MKFFYEICNLLREGIAFKMSRWGDGEWGCMYGWKGKNRDGNEYLPELENELLDILISEPRYYMGLQYGVLYNQELRKFVFGELFAFPSINWVNGDVLHQASEFGYLGEFVDALKEREVVIIGAEYFSELPYNHIVIPDNDSYYENDRTLKEIDENIIYEDNPYYENNPVFIVAAAMNSNIIIDKIWDHVTAIDIGSVFDPYLGRPRASYQHNMKVEWLW